MRHPTSRLSFATLAILGSVAGCDSAFPGAGRAPAGDARQADTDGAADHSPLPGVTTYAGVTGPASLDAAVALLADVRAALGLPPARRVATLTAPAQAHAEYVAAHQTFTGGAAIAVTQEAAQLPGFTGVAPIERVAAAGYDGRFVGEVIGFKPLPVGSLQEWLETLYHRSPLIRREAVEVGFGGALRDGLAVHVVDVGADAAALAAAGAAGLPLVAYPPDEAEDVPPAWGGREAPQPRPPPGGYPSGPVLTLSAPSGSLPVASASVRPDSGTPVAVTLLTVTTTPTCKRATWPSSPTRRSPPARATCSRSRGRAPARRSH